MPLKSTDKHFARTCQCQPQAQIQCRDGAVAWMNDKISESFIFRAPKITLVISISFNTNNSYTFDRFPTNSIVLGRGQAHSGPLQISTCIKFNIICILQVWRTKVAVR